MIFNRKRKHAKGTPSTTTAGLNNNPSYSAVHTSLNAVPLQSSLVYPNNNVPESTAYPTYQVYNQDPTTLYPSQYQLPIRGPPLYDGNGTHEKKWRSDNNFPATNTKPDITINHGVGDWQDTATGYLNQGAALCDLISNKLNAIITSIDGERFSGDERELVVYQYPEPVSSSRGLTDTWKATKGANEATSSAVTSSNYFAKASLYANAKLPPNLLPLKLYMPTYPLLCLAAQFSQRVYTRPTGAEREAHVDADWRHGTKAMVIKSIPVDDMNTVVFAIRGSQTFMDWAVNLNSAPTSPVGFLDDTGNLCHSGFLSVARKMIRPVAARLRSLLEEDPSRSSCSLLITGHSAGGAVAALLYAHMMAAEVESELNILTDCFKRVHCVTFGAPPVSLLPLQKPTTPRRRKSLFMSFVNEGDPVPRADKAYVRSLLDLYSSPAPGSSCLSALLSPTSKMSKPAKSHLKFVPIKRPKAVQTISTPATPAVVWKIPPATLSNAGRIILLRVRPAGRTGDSVQACITSDEQLRGVIFGDPVMHMMKVYARRIEILATNAVTARAC